MTSEPGWLAPLRRAYEEPWSTADRWHADGGRVIGLIGALAPREIALAGGFLPVRLRPAALVRGSAHLPADARVTAAPALPDGLARELAPDSAAILAALLAGELAWVDGLLIGRDSEQHTKLFYVIRELAGDPEWADRVPPFAFSDVLRLGVRTSSTYNRVRLRQLVRQLSEWAGAEITPDRIAAAVADDNATAACLRELDGLRSAGPITGHQALIAAGGSQVLPGAEARSALAGGVQADPRPGAGPRSRLFLTGSDLDDPWAYAVIEATGAAIVGEDHGWGDDGRGHAANTVDPIDGLADRYQFTIRGAARTGLTRAARTAERAHALGVDAVVQIVSAHDEASGWELAELRARLGDIPVRAVALTHDGDDAERLREAAYA